MKIIFALNGPNELNGPNVWLSRMLPLLKREGVDVGVLYLKSFVPLKKECAILRTIRNAGVPVTTVNLSLFIEENVSRIVQIISKLQPDFFIPNYCLAGFYAAKFLKSAGTQTLAVLHSDDPYYRDITEMFLKDGSDWKVSGSIEVSKYLYEGIESRETTSLPHRYIPYGCEIPTAKTKKEKLPFTIVYSGRLVKEQKRADRVMEVMVDAAKRWPEQVRCFCLGDGPERRMLQQRIIDEGQESRIKLHGACDPNQVMEFLKESHVLLLLSDYEGMSIALQEAMASGVVPIVTRIKSGSDELVVHGKTGWIVDVCNYTDAMEYLGDMISNPNLLETLSHNAQLQISKLGLDNERCAKDWLGFLNELLIESKSDSEELGKKMPDLIELPPKMKNRDGMFLHENRMPWAYVNAAKKQNRKIVAWGAGEYGRQFLRESRKLGFTPDFYVDSNASVQNTKMEGVPIRSPDYLLDIAQRPFVVITSQYKNEIALELESMGFEFGIDFD